MQPEPQVRSRSAGQALVCLVLFLGGLALLALRIEPPPARGPEAPSGEFSAVRALQRWRRLPGSALPHPLGSAAHAELRAALVSAFESLGCTPELQEALVVHGNLAARVHNVLVRLPGRTRDPAVLLAAHYDSVPAGPGAGDDGAGAASVLEIARALRDGAPLERDVILLVDDGEELGLLGARAFCEQHRWARDVGLVVNLEARGTSGPCFLFETSDENAALIGLAARVLPRSSAWSASQEVYQRMPNDTDLTVFKAQGWQGFNLAFVRGLRHYHTPRDEAAQLSPDSVQQMGENALALVRALAGGELDPTAQGRAVYAEFFGLALLHWNARANLPILAALSLALGFAVVTRRRAGRWRLARVGAAAGASLLALFLCAGLCWLVQAGVQAGRGSDWPPAAEPGWMRAALLACIVAGSFGAAALPWSSRAGIEERWAASTLLGAVLALLLVLAFPAASYLALVPLVLALLGFALHEIRRERRPGGAPWMLGVPACAGALGVCGPLLVALEWVFEFRLCAALGVLGALVLAPLLPLVASTPRLARAVSLLALLAAAGAGWRAHAAPSWSPAHPAPLDFARLQAAGAGEARWFAMAAEAELPAALVAGGFARASDDPLGLPRRPGVLFAHPALPAAPLAGAEVRATRGPAGGREIALRSPRAARMLLLRMPREWRRLRIACGRLSNDELCPAGGLVLLAGFGAEELRLEAAQDPASARRLELDEIDTLAPGDGGDLRAGRPAAFVPLGWGDLSLVRTTLEW